MPAHAALRPDPDGPGPVQPVPGGDRGVRPAHARPPRPRVPGRARRDVRSAADRLADRQPADPAAVGHRLGRHGGGVRQHRRPGRRRRRRRQRPVRRAHVRRRRPLRGRGGPGRRARGASRSTPSRCWPPTPHPKVIAVVHAETSTGVRNDIEPLGAGKGDALLLVDCVTSLGGIPVDGRRAGASTSPTAAPRSASACRPGWPRSPWAPRATERRIAKPQSWYLDLGMIADYASTGGARKYHHTAPVAMIMSLHAGLGALLDEGLEASWARHAECGAPAAGRPREARPRAVRRRRATGCPS